MMDAGQIYEEFQPKVRAYVRGKIHDPHDADDLVSAVFMKVVQKLDSYDPDKASISTWVYTITRNTVTDYFRTRRSMVTWWTSNRRSSLTMRWIVLPTRCLPSRKRHAT